VAVGAAYLVWRAGWTLNTGALWLALPLLTAELHGYFTFLTFVFMVWDVRPPAYRAAPPGKTVDFYIPTYHEPYDVLAPTIAAAVAITYPHETFVLDDGRRPWVHDLCRRLGARYITREGNAGAKAGNINAALHQTAGEFIAVVDADFVPRPDYIDQLLGYFDDREMAIVQGPQEFYNVSSFQHADNDRSAWHEQRMFFRVIQVGKNRWNSAFWSGAPSMLRRAAVEDLGGIPTETVTEDLHTSVLLHRKGWKTAFHPGVIALGVAPEDYSGFILQRLRWAQGAMQVIRRDWLKRGLSIPQRINYVGSTGTYFDAFRKATMLVIVPAILLTDTLPVSAPQELFLFAWATQFVLLVAANIALGRGNYRYLHTEMFDLLKMFAFVQATITLVVSTPLKFKVTPKGEAGARTLHPFLVPFVVVFGIYLVAIAVGAARIAGWGINTANHAAMIAALGWGIALLAVLSVVLGYGYYHVSRRRASRLFSNVPAAIRSTSLTWAPFVETGLNDLSMTGCAFTTDHAFQRGETVEVQLIPGAIRLGGTVRSVFRAPRGFRVGVEFSLSVAEQDALAAVYARTIFEASPWVERYDRPGSPLPLRPTRPRPDKAEQEATRRAA
jgi:cellulose synthase (UDP-forming)